MLGGEIVVALPSRDTLMVTGSENREGIAALKQAIQRIYADSPYHLTPRLFIRRNGKYDEFKK